MATIGDGLVRLAYTHYPDPVGLGTLKYCHFGLLFEV